MNPLGVEERSKHENTGLPTGRPKVRMLDCQLWPTNSLAEGTVWAAGRSLPGMSLAFALHGSTQRFHRLLRHAVARARTPHQASPA